MTLNRQLIIVKAYDGELLVHVSDGEMVVASTSPNFVGMTVKDAFVLSGSIMKHWSEQAQDNIYPSQLTLTIH